MKYQSGPSHSQLPTHVPPYHSPWPCQQSPHNTGAKEGCPRPGEWEFLHPPCMVAIAPSLYLGKYFNLQCLKL